MPRDQPNGMTEDELTEEMYEDKYDKLNELLALQEYLEDHTQRRKYTLPNKKVRGDHGGHPISNHLRENASKAHVKAEKTIEKELKKACEEANIDYDMVCYEACVRKHLTYNNMSKYQPWMKPKG